MNPFDFADYDALKELHPHCPLTRAGYEAALEEQRERRIEELIERYIADPLHVYDAINGSDAVLKAISEIAQLVVKMDAAKGRPQEADHVTALIEQCRRIEDVVVGYVNEIARNDA